jgi:undecaprenol kinase
MKQLETKPYFGMNNQNEAEKEFDRLQFEQSRNLEKYYLAPNLIRSFSHAFYGIKETWLCQRNFKIHTLCAAVAVCLGLLLKLDTMSWLALMLTIAFVLTAELINTALEHLVDLAANSLYHPLAKAAKDASAGAVLIASAFAVISGLIIFVPPFLNLFFH